MKKKNGSNAEKLQTVLDSLIGKGGVRNVALAVRSEDGRIDFAGAAGVAHPETGAAMTADSAYFLASVTKMYTASIVMRLHAEQRLDLDAHIEQFLPSELLNGLHRHKGVERGREIKVHHLLAQTSGLPDHEMDRPPHETSLISKLKSGHDIPVSTVDAVEICKRIRPRFAPGTPGRAHYSNTNYRLLGAIVESVTGCSMADNFRNLLDPLGLSKTRLFRLDDPDGSQFPAAIYLGASQALVPKYMASNVSDGGLVSTARESLDFLRCYFEGRLLPRELVDRMATWNRIFFPLDYGYGLMRFKLPRFFWPTRLPEFVGHSGSTGSFAFYCPARRLYLAGTVNQISNPARPFFLMMELVRTIDKN